MARKLVTIKVEARVAVVEWVDVASPRLVTVGEDHSVWTGAPIPHEAEGAFVRAVLPDADGARVQATVDALRAVARGVKPEPGKRAAHPVQRQEARGVAAVHAVVDELVGALRVDEETRGRVREVVVDAMARCEEEGEG